ncbi:glyoxylase-like metal-dependent hydrolase (beta-lactamase superfamily II) [Flavobacterium croceum DSM 17960]|uniref:Glyoxylase-like metal-dependent hydrolase (Beta-lactamase superfamily II) n=1 Tax=Flavobacterium croceum DSM 17960 TaxID=1121886 RepID=A0A2S4N674_9FLAO|nr:MBL fold metallo-hydrolase [Flavobacterium croceum]POS00803.1 glyoxylase-like metal-dependent hydrolase (beta-lactamase superfamily II) [Flavobacterium croceum DSM 17960]
MHQIIQLSIFPFGMINCFLIKGEKKHILVDTGVPNSETKIIKQLKKHNIKPEDIGLIIITHGHIDHFGSAKELKDILKIPILMHGFDKVALQTGKSMFETLKPNHKIWDIVLKPKLAKDTASPCLPDVVLDENEEYDLSIYGIKGKVIHTPGHTPGSLSVVLENGEAIIMDLASSGILLGGIIFNSRMKHPPFHDNLDQVKKSINKILSLKTEKFYLGHGNPVSKKSLIKYRDNFL